MVQDPLSVLSQVDFAEFMLIFKIGEMYPGPFALDRLVKDHSQKRKMTVDEEVRGDALAAASNKAERTLNGFLIFFEVKFGFVFSAAPYGVPEALRTLFFWQPSPPLLASVGRDSPNSRWISECRS